MSGWKKTHNSTDEGREPKPEEGFLLEPPKLAELGELEVVVNLLPGEEGITTFLDRRHICTDPLSVFFCFWRISLGLHKYLSIVTFIFVKSQNSYFLCVIHDIFQTSLCNAASIVYIVSCKMSSFRCSLISILFKGTCDKYRLCVFGQVTSLQDWSLMVFSLKGTGDRYFSSQMDVAPWCYL